MSQFWHKVGKTLRYHGSQAARKIRGVRWNTMPGKAQRPVFVVGCSRAGTTLVYKTLSESPRLGSLQRETHDFWVGLHPLDEKNWDTHALTAHDASEADRDYVTRYFYQWTGCSRFVDKNNQNGLCVSYLHALFPDACFVYVKRGPGDNINSLIEGWGRPQEFASWSHSLPATVSVDNGQYRQWCFFLADGWRQFTRASIEEVCAFQYRSINEAILSAASAIPAAQWYEVRYEDIVRDPVEGFRGMFGYFDLGFDAAVEMHTRKVLDHPYNAFSEIRLDKWKTGRNSEKIERALPLVKAVAAEMGY